MSTTTIRLPDELKARVTTAAARSGKSAHAFILEAIAEKTDADEQRAAFLALGEERYGEIAASGKTIAWAEMRAYLSDRIAGGKRRRPVAKKLAR